MLIGEPYLAYVDEDLMDDRRACKRAVMHWNQAHSDSRPTSDEEKGRLFQCILDPSRRTEPNHQYRDYASPQARPGSIGSRVIIDNPFTCDYGYNIHIGDDTYIGANCTIEDPCDIFIGSRVQIGKNVTLCGSIANEDSFPRKGSQATLTGGAIIIEDEVIIGNGTIIHAHRVIGKGASVRAGSVVTRVSFAEIVNFRCEFFANNISTNRTSHPTPSQPETHAESSAPCRDLIARSDSSATRENSQLSLISAVLRAAAAAKTILLVIGSLR
jgi:acetyltransferase-like isoleucine patch superfamily enzyme